MIERLVWFVPLAVAVFGTWRPRVGVLVLVATLPFFGSPPGGPYLAALDAACVAAILTAWRGGRGAHSPLTWPAVAFVVVSLASLVPSPYLPPSWQPTALVGLVTALPGAESWSALYAWRSAADLVLGFAMFLAVRRAFAGHSQRPLFAAILAGFAAVIILGLASQLGLVDLTVYRPKVPLVTWSNRLQSVFFLSGWLSKYLVVAAPPALVFLAGEKHWNRALLALAASSTFACLVLAQSRGAWLAIGAQLLVSAALVVKRRMQTPALGRALIATAALSVVLVGVVAVAGGSLRTVDRPDPLGSGLSSRLSLWSSAADMVRARPLLGTGLGTFAPAYDLLNPEGSERARPHHSTAHNLYLHVAAERGFLGLAALCLLGVSVAISLRRAIADHQWWAVGTALSLVGTAFYGLTQYMMYLRNIHWLLWILLASTALCAGTGCIRHTKRAAHIVALAALATLPFRFLTAETQRYPGNREFGFHETEANEDRSFRWTAASAAQRLDRQDGDLILTLANGHPASGERPVTVVVGIEGTEVATVEVAGDWQEHRIVLAPETPPSFLITLRAHPTFRPFSELPRLDPASESEDVRRLGVAVLEARWELAAGPGSVPDTP